METSTYTVTLRRITAAEGHAHRARPLRPRCRQVATWYAGAPLGYDEAVATWYADAYARLTDEMKAQAAEKSITFIQFS